MVWQRLMTYAHQNIDIKPIPGIKNPYVDPKVAEKAAEMEQKNADAVDVDMGRPPILSSATTRVLREMGDAFHTAPPLGVPAEPETLSVL